MGVGCIKVPPGEQPYPFLAEGITGKCYGHFINPVSGVVIPCGCDISIYKSGNFGSGGGDDSTAEEHEPVEVAVEEPEEPAYERNEEGDMVVTSKGGISVQAPSTSNMVAERSSSGEMSKSSIEPDIVLDEDIDPSKSVLPLTLDELFIANGSIRKPNCEFFLNAINEILPKYNIITFNRVCHWLAQMTHESGQFIKTQGLAEGLNYSENSLLKTFPAYFDSTGSGTSNAPSRRGNRKRRAKDYANQGERWTNWVYGNRMDNGDEATGDGFRYIGRGIIQLTGRANYTAFTRSSGIDIVSNPSLAANDANTMVEIACWFWNRTKREGKNLNTLADENNIELITRAINGGTIGMDHRVKMLNFARQALAQKASN